MTYPDFHTHSIPSVGMYNWMVDEWLADPKPPSALVSVGIHPWYVAAHELNVHLQRLEEIAALPQVRCIGECGLDRLQGPALPLQTEAFRAQALLAEEVQKPVVIHCVRAHQELLALHAALKPDVPWILHGFVQKHQTALPFIQHDFYFSFGAALRNPQSSASRVLPLIPMNRVLLETDTADCSIQQIYEAAAERLSLPVEVLVEKIFTTFAAICGKF
ncbi:TatD family hydrolase [Arundinibacter roseus]|nr:TatD family hydrolase [Arundinibacter roseus]